MTNLTALPDGAVPAHIAARTGVANQDLSSGVSAGFGQISYKGKVWHLVEGQSRLLLADPATGDLPPGLNWREEVTVNVRRA